MFSKTGNINLYTPKVAKVLRCIEVEKRGPRIEGTSKAQSVISENHENKIVEMDVIIKNLTKIVEEWKAEKECRDTKQNSDFEIELSRSGEKCDEKFATEVDLNAHIGKKHRKVTIQVELASLNNDETKPANEKTFKWERCGKELKFQSSLQEHKYLIAVNVKNYFSTLFN